MQVCQPLGRWAGLLGAGGAWRLTWLGAEGQQDTHSTACRIAPWVWILGPPGNEGPFLSSCPSLLPVNVASQNGQISLYIQEAGTLDLIGKPPQIFEI